MGVRMEQGFPVFGEHDADTLTQLITCARAGDAFGAALMADGHKGYSMPIGGVVAYRSYISPSGVGYDIACGNKAIRTNLVWGDIKKELARIMDEIFKTVSFGLGRKNNQPTDHELYDDPTWKEIPVVGELKPLAMAQEGTVGTGNPCTSFLEHALLEFPDTCNDSACQPPHLPSVDAVGSKPVAKDILAEVEHLCRVGPRIRQARQQVADFWLVLIVGGTQREKSHRVRPVHRLGDYCGQCSQLFLVVHPFHPFGNLPRGKKTENPLGWSQEGLNCR